MGGVLKCLETESLECSKQNVMVDSGQSSEDQSANGIVDSKI